MDEIVSIIVPCYNHEKYIPDFIEGLVAQTYQRIELLVCDDCSSDSSYDMFCSERERLEKRFEKVFIIRNETNCGITITANKLIREASGKYIKLIASDDILWPEYIEEVVNAFCDDESIDVIVTNGISVEDSFRYKKSVALTDEKLVYKKNPDFSTNLFERLYEGNFIFAPGMIFKTYLFDECGMFDESIQIEDWEYVLRLAQKGKKFLFYDKPLVYYRKSLNSATSMVNNTNFEKRRITVFTSELKILDNYGDYIDPSKKIARRVQYLSDTANFAYQNRFNRLMELVKTQSVFSFNDIRIMGIALFLRIRIKMHLRNAYYFIGKLV